MNSDTIQKLEKSIETLLGQQLPNGLEADGGGEELCIADRQWDLIPLDIPDEDDEDEEWGFDALEHYEALAAKINSALGTDFVVRYSPRFSNDELYPAGLTTQR